MREFLLHPTCSIKLVSILSDFVFSVQTRWLVFLISLFLQNSAESRQSPKKTLAESGSRILYPRHCILGPIDVYWTAWRLDYYC